MAMASLLLHSPWCDVAQHRVGVHPDRGVAPVLLSFLKARGRRPPL
jgi:hypothetical protein